MTTSFFQKIQYEYDGYKAVPNGSPYYASASNRYRQMILKIKRYKSRIIAISLLITIPILYIFGVFVHPFELDFDTNFQYPIHTNDFRYFIEAAKIKKDLKESALKPINNYSYTYYLNPTNKCQLYNDINLTKITEKRIPLTSPTIPLHYPITLLIVVKSATCNFLLRNIIRQTWGFEQRFSDVTIKTVFMLGECSAEKEAFCDNTFHQYPNLILSRKSNHFRSLLNNNKTLNCQKVIELEQNFYDDLVQADFLDSYYNNTRKTMASLQWTVQFCSKVPYIFFVDDDYYVSIKNLLKFSKNFLHIAQKQNSRDSMTDTNDDDNVNDRLLQINNDEKSTSNSLDLNTESNDNEITHDNNEIHFRTNAFDGRLYAGFVFKHSRPHRHVTSKWYVNLDEYPYNRYPPYVTGGCFLVNNQTAIDLYYASLFTKPFKYDDVYLGILAQKMQIKPLSENDRMHFYKLPYKYNKPEHYKDVIASHGYHDPEELWYVWNEQKTLGFA